MPSAPASSSPAQSSLAPDYVRLTLPRHARSRTSQRVPSHDSATPVSADLLVSPRRPHARAMHGAKHPADVAVPAPTTSQARPCPSLATMLPAHYIADSAYRPLRPRNATEEDIYRIAGVSFEPTTGSSSGLLATSFPAAPHGGGEGVGHGPSVRRSTAGIAVRPADPNALLTYLRAFSGPPPTVVHAGVLDALIGAGAWPHAALREVLEWPHWSFRYCAPAMAAVEARDAATLRLLLDDLRLDPNTGCPVRAAVEAGDVEMLERLLRHPRISPNRGYPLFTAVLRNCGRMVAMLLEHPRTHVNKYAGGYSMSPLIASIRFGRQEAFGAVIACPRVDLNRGFCCTPLQAAVMAQRVECVRALLARPSLDPARQVTSSDVPGCVALAAEYGDPEIMRLLLSDGRASVPLSLLDALEEDGHFALLEVLAAHGRGELGRMGFLWSLRYVSAFVVAALLVPIGLLDVSRAAHWLAVSARTQAAAVVIGYLLATAAVACIVWSNCEQGRRVALRGSVPQAPSHALPPPPSEVCPSSFAVDAELRHNFAPTARTKAQEQLTAVSPTHRSPTEHRGGGLLAGRLCGDAPQVLWRWARIPSTDRDGAPHHPFQSRRIGGLFGWPALRAVVALVPVLPLVEVAALAVLVMQATASAPNFYAREMHFQLLLRCATARVWLCCVPLALMAILTLTGLWVPAEDAARSVSREEKGRGALTLLLQITVTAAVLLTGRIQPAHSRARPLRPPFRLQPPQGV